MAEVRGDKTAYLQQGAVGMSAVRVGRGWVASVSWERRLEEYVRSKPPVLRMAKSIAALGRKVTRPSIGPI